MDNTNKPVEDPEIRRCKKCGCELVSTNKHSRCELCRRKRAEAWKKGAEATAATITLVITAFYRYLNNGKKDDSDKGAAYQPDSSGPDEVESGQSGSSSESDYYD